MRRSWRMRVLGVALLGVGLGWAIVQAVSPPQVLRFGSSVPRSSGEGAGMQLTLLPARTAWRSTASTLTRRVTLLAAREAWQAQGATGWPNANNTGVPAGTSLTTVNGNVTLSTNGQIYEAKLVNGCITVTAPNVIIRKSKVICTQDSAIWNDSTNLLVEDVEVDLGNAVGRTAITPQNYTARRVHVYGGENLLWAQLNVLIEDSYIHDPVDYDVQLDPHTDSIQIPSGSDNITIRHNTVYGNYVNASDFGNSAITMGGGNSNITVTNNLLAGGGYTLYCNQEGFGGAGTNMHYTQNHFSKIFTSTYGGFGPMTDCANETDCTGNVDHETGAPLACQ